MDYYSDDLASPWRRLMASCLDLAILAIPLLLMASPDIGATRRWFEPELAQRLPLVGMLALIGFVIGNIYLLRTRAQTPGKILFGLRIEVDESLLPLGQDVPDPITRSETLIDVPEAIRYIPFLLAAPFTIFFPWLPPVAVVVIVAPMFGNSRRGFHDYFGRSRVVDVDDDEEEVH